MAEPMYSNKSGGFGGEGKSAYEVAVDNGYDGDESAWLASLKGEKGDPGKQGTKGDTGNPGEPGAPGNDGNDGFGTEAQYDDIIARLDALEDTE